MAKSVEDPGHTVGDVKVRFGLVAVAQDLEVRARASVEGVLGNGGGGPGPQVLGEEVGFSDGQVVVERHRAQFDQLVGKMAADETRPANDERAHRSDIADATR